MSTTPGVSRSPFGVSVEAGSYRVTRPGSASEVIDLLKKHNIQIVDLKFTDLPGLWQHFSITLPEVHPDLFSAGIGFDGSSIRGFQEIHESDMLLRPDPATAFIDPVCGTPTLSIICDVVDPVLQQPYSRDPRYVAKKAENYLRQTGIATTCYFGPELEFFIFDSIRFGQDQHCGYYYVESAEGDWNTGRDEGAYGGGNLGYKQRYKEGYFPVPPSDTLQEIRSASPRGGDRRTERDRHAFRDTDAHGRQRDDLQIRLQERSAPARQSGNLHAEAAVCRQRERHALSPEPVERQRESLLRCERVGADFGNMPVVYRRITATRARADGLLRANDEFLQASGAGV
jgi:hypothetical protein